MKAPTAIILCLVASCLSAFGLSLKIIPWDDAVAKRKLAITHGDKMINIGYLHPAARSKPISIPQAAENLRLVTPDNKDENGKPLGVRIKIPAAISNPLMLLVPDKKSIIGLRPLFIEDSKSAFGWGTFRIINVSSQPLVFRWDKKGKVIPSGWKPVNITPGGKTRNMEIFLYLQAKPKEPIYTAVWEHRNDMRQLVFVVPSSDVATGPYQFKFVPELRLPEPANTPGTP